MPNDTLRFLGLGALTAGAAATSVMAAAALRQPERVPVVDALKSEPPGGGEWPFISVIVPARNEERNLPRLLPTLLSQRYPNYEVIVVDDQSTDGTGALLDDWARRDSRLHVLHGADLPHEEGWFGKPHAMHQGVSAAKGDWLLFTDADTKHAPESISSSVAFAMRHNVDLFTLGPCAELETVSEKIIMPVAYQGIFILYPPSRVNDPRTDVAIANGQYIMIRRGVYDAVGGIASVKNKIAEDLEFGKRIKRLGYRLFLADGRHLMSVRMYTNLREIWEGWSKNVVLSFEENPGQGVFAVFGTASIGLMPLVLGRWALLANRTARRTRRPADRFAARWVAALAVMDVLGPLAYRLRVDREIGLSPGWALTQPVGGVAFALIMLSSFVRLLQGKGVTWKGRTYAAKG